MKEDPYEASDVSELYPEKVRSLGKLMKEELRKEKALYPISKEGKVCEPIF